MGSLHLDDPLLTTASQARHAPRAVGPMDRIRLRPAAARQRPDRYRGRMLTAPVSHLVPPLVTA
jgi:hypothetical protein